MIIFALNVDVRELISTLFNPKGPKKKWPISILKRNRDGFYFYWIGTATHTGIKSPQKSWMAVFYFPMNGLEGLMKLNFPMHSNAAVYFITTAKPWTEK